MCSITPHTVAEDQFPIPHTVEEQQAAWDELCGINSVLTALAAHEDPENLLPEVQHPSITAPISFPAPSSSSVTLPIQSNAVGTGACPNLCSTIRIEVSLLLPVAGSVSCCPVSLARRQACCFLSPRVFHIYAKQITLAGEHNPFILTELGPIHFLLFCRVVPKLAGGTQS